MDRKSPGATVAGTLESLFTLGTVGCLTDDQLLERFFARTEEVEAEAAFATIVERHGAMVHSVCKRIVSEPSDADDAFQATFLVLARRAGSIRGRGSVAGWLFGVARRVAMRARKQATRRRRRLKQLYAERRIWKERAETDSERDSEPDHSPLIAAIDRLPERLRSPVVLHYFEGLDTAAVAQRLGCPRGTVLSRLARGRARLRRRLGDRNFTREVLLPVASEPSRILAREMVSSRLFQSTVQAASRVSSAGGGALSVAPPIVATLSRGAIHRVFSGQSGLALGLVALSVFGMTMGLAALLSPAEHRGPEPAVQNEIPAKQMTSADPVRKDEHGPLIVHGLVLDPDGRPIDKARIVTGTGLFDEHGWRSPVVWPAEHLATTNGDGRFQVRWNLGAFDPTDLEPGQTSPVWLIAALSPGFGPGLCRVDASDTRREQLIRLRRDDVPIEGQVVDRAGRPVPAASVHIIGIADLPDGIASKPQEEGRTLKSSLEDELNAGLIMGESGPISSVRTGPDGRFRLTGIGRDRVAGLLVNGDTIDRKLAMVLTSSQPALGQLHFPAVIPGDIELFGPRFTIAVDPGRPIDGIIRDAGTGRPIAGARVHSWAIGMSAVSDLEGRFRVNGSPVSQNALIAKVDGQPYIEVVKHVGNSTDGNPTLPPKTEPIRADLSLRRGVWIDGRIVDRATGQPVKASVEYYPLRDNANLKDLPDAWFFFSPYVAPHYRTDTDGRFRALALPGEGVIVVRARGYRSALLNAPAVAGEAVHPGKIPLDFSYCNAIVPIHPEDRTSTVLPRITLDPGHPLRVQAVHLDERPITGIRWFCSQNQSPRGEAVAGSEFTFKHETPGHPLPVVVLEQNRESGAVIMINGDEPDTVRVTLQRTGMAAGRLVDSLNRPRPRFRFRLDSAAQSPDGISHSAPLSRTLITDGEGRFVIKGLVPGLTYGINLPAMAIPGRRRWTVKPAETLDLGDTVVGERRPEHRLDLGPLSNYDGWPY